MVSVHDPDARHAHKTVARRQDGFKAHVAVEPDTGLVTDCRLGKASGEDSGDAAVGIELLATEQEPVEVLADSAYGTGAMLAELREAEHTATIKPWPLRHPIPGGFTTADFTVDETTRTITCPAGATMTFSKVKRSARFGARCQGCPLRERCTTSARGRTVVLHRHDALQRAHRTRFADPAVLKVGRTQHRLARRRRQPPAALPRNRQERRLAAPAHRSAEPAPATHPRTAPSAGDLGDHCGGLTPIRDGRTRARADQRQPELVTATTPNPLAVRSAERRTAKRVLHPGSLRRSGNVQRGPSAWSTGKASAGWRRQRRRRAS